MNWEVNQTVFGSDEFAPKKPAEPRSLPFSFTGSGSEFFRIWIVNTLLTIVTLGIYSAWAKVRTMQYFYRSTQLDGATFDYHGKPQAILKGRAIVFGVAMVYQVLIGISPVVGGLLGVALTLVFPYLLVRSLRFRMANSSYRGLRFAFTGDDKGGFMVFLVWPMLTALSLLLLGPLAHQRFKQYQHNNTRFGTTPFAFDATAGAFYRVYLMTAGLTLLFLIAGAVIGSVGSLAHPVLAIVLGVITFYIALLLILPIFQAKMQNLIWNSTTLAPHRFQSNVSARKLFGIMIGNMVLTALTLGLYYPFARVRTARYRVASMTMLAASPLDEFVAGEQQQVGALGDATADWYDIDIAL
ncbi:YjgN family protein [Cupriavidus sp. DL-D2]|uniref:YjgN family protein n=1 Tax=Cupriavidus sp. DL-D2 TaxID=3144974 RepID=UPI003212FD4D